MDDFKPNEYKTLSSWKSSDEEELDRETDAALKKKKDQSQKKSESSSTADQFIEPSQALQVRLPRDLVKSLKLMNIRDEKSISEIVLECLTSKRMIQKCWINRKDANAA